MGKIVIIGGGFFGMYLAEHFALSGHNVHLVERESDFMMRASFNNQARVHNGYHYPRSVLTALRSRISFPRFVEEFSDCIDSSFEKYYLIGSILGKVSARHFYEFCVRIGAICDPAPDSIQKLVNPNLIENCFSVKEYAFDAVKLRDIMKKRLEAASVKCSMDTSVEKVTQEKYGLSVTVTNLVTEITDKIEADQVFNCTYSRINYVLSKSQIEIIHLKHEMTEMCLVEVPQELKNVGVTVMCGPFFSVMPFPSAGLHSFSHVRYTPHYEWYDEKGLEYSDSQKKIDEDLRFTAWKYMQQDAKRYLPVLSECRYQSSLWEVKTVLPRSETDDSRPILFRANHGLSGFHCVMGGKIDNVYDVIESIKSLKLLN